MTLDLKAMVLVLNPVLTENLYLWQPSSDPTFKIPLRKFSSLGFAVSQQSQEQKLDTTDTKGKGTTIQTFFLEYLLFLGSWPVISKWLNGSWENYVPYPEQLHEFNYRACKWMLTPVYTSYPEHRDKITRVISVVSGVGVTLVFHLWWPV